MAYFLLWGRASLDCHLFAPPDTEHGVVRIVGPHADDSSVRLVRWPFHFDRHDSCVCPAEGLSRDRPESRVQEPTEPALRFQNKSQLAAKQAMVTSADVAGTLVEAIRDNRFFVLTHEGSVELARQRYQWIEIDNNTSKIGRPIE
jgi:hypothetical protein